MSALIRADMSIYFADDFHDADGTALEDHAPTVGSSWDVDGGGLEVLGNLLTCPTYYYGRYWASPGPSVADYSVTATLHLDMIGGDGGVTVLARDPGTSGMAGYYALYDIRGGSWELRAGPISGGSSLLDSSATSLSAPADYAVELRVAGSSVAFYLDSALLLSATDTTYAAAGQCAVGLSGDYATGIQLSSFQVSDIGGVSPGTHTLTGAGSVAIGSPGAISLSLDSAPVWIQPGRMEPPNFFHLGLIAWGNSNGEMRPQPVIFLEQLFVVPAGMTTLYWWLENGVTGTAVELVGP